MSFSKGLKTRVFIASDHAGLELKAALQTHLPEYDWIDLGPNEKEGKVDYPDYAQLLSHKIAEGQNAFGVLICGSGIGMCISANKVPGIRAALVENPVSARLSREHNDANVLCLGSRFLAVEYSVEITRNWLETPFSKDPRHQRRIEKIEQKV
jgi:ribose 5-phosphate isomerase B